MLQTLRIRNLATIEDLELGFEAGFSILTGETGAGKSMIIGSIRLVTGEKTGMEIIRTGESETKVEAVFSASPTVPAPGSEDGFFLGRHVLKNGHGKGYLNGDMVPVRRLAETGRELVDIYGQNDHVFLRKIESQLDYLDAYAETIEARKTVAELTRELRRLAREKRELLTREMEREQRLDFLDFQIREIEAAELEPNEEEAIRRERELLKNAENIRVWVEEALDLSYNRDDAVLPLLTRLEVLTTRLTAYDEDMGPDLESIGQFTITLREFSDRLIRLKERQDGSPGKLDDLEKRLSRIEDLKRKYGKGIPAILDYLEKARAERTTLNGQRNKLEEIQESIGRIDGKYRKKALDLSKKRKQGAARLEKAIEREISRLGMKKAVFRIRIETKLPDPDEISQLSDSGADLVEFDISPNPGEEPKPLRRIASGGELSRLMLALKSVAGEAEEFKTLIFDEIDAGIGGKTADFVARKLTDLAKRNQVICITHLPQIASAARHHYKIAKQVRDGRTYTSVKKLTGADRIQEIARLLVGGHITETALKNAREMLERNSGQSFPAPDGEPA